MPVRHALVSVAVLGALAAPSAAVLAPTAGYASTVDAGVLPQKTHFDLQAHRGGIG